MSTVTFWGESATPPRFSCLAQIRARNSTPILGPGKATFYMPLLTDPQLLQYLDLAPMGYLTEPDDAKVPADLLSDPYNQAASPWRISDSYYTEESAIIKQWRIIFSKLGYAWDPNIEPDDPDTCLEDTADTDPTTLAMRKKLHFTPDKRLITALQTHLRERHKRLQHAAQEFFLRDFNNLSPEELQTALSDGAALSRRLMYKDPSPLFLLEDYSTSERYVLTPLKLLTVLRNVAVPQALYLGSVWSFVKKGG